MMMMMMMMMMQVTLSYLANDTKFQGGTRDAESDLEKFNSDSRKF